MGLGDNLFLSLFFLPRVLIVKLSYAYCIDYISHNEFFI